MKANCWVWSGVAFLLLLASCKPQNNNTPIAPGEMEKLLMDVQLAEVYSTMVARDTAKHQALANQDSLALYYKSVLAHHHTTAEKFEQSLYWYRQHPEQLDTIYIHTVNRLSNMERKTGVRLPKR